MIIEIELGDQKMSLPLDFTWKQWMRMQKYELDKMSDLDIIHICTGWDHSFVKKASLEQVKEISGFLSQYYFTDPLENKIETTFEFDGIVYGLQKDFSKLSYGSWVDLEVYSAEEVNKNIPKIMANLYYEVIGYDKDKPILKDYDDKDVNIKSKLFEDIPMKYWFGASTFFLLFVKEYTQSIVNSLHGKIMMEKLMMRGLKVFPKFLQKKLLRAFTSKQSKSSQKKI